MAGHETYQSRLPNARYLNQKRNGFTEINGGNALQAFLNVAAHRMRRPKTF